MKKKFVVLLSCALTLTYVIPAYAGQWFKDNNKWAYQNDDGQQIKEGWFTDTDGKVYNFNGGVVRSGFYQENGVYYYFNPTSGERMSGWVNDGGKYYFMNIAGVMQTGWQNVNGAWYYLDGSGAMYSDKVADINGNRYYFHPDGHMAMKEWVKDNTYYASDNGMIATGTWVDNTYVNGSGKATDKDTSSSTKKEKIENKVFTLAEYKAFASDSYGRYYDMCNELHSYIQEYREQYNEDNVYNYSGDDDNYVEERELPEFDYDDKLAEAAALRAVELASQQRASGARPDGRELETVLSDYGITFSRVAESVAFGQEDAEACYKDLKDAGSHTSYWREKSYTKMGVGLAYDASGKPYWVVLYVE